jgi:hypothetical protein
MERTKLEVPAYLRDDTVRIKCTVTVFKERAATNSGTRNVRWRRHRRRIA